MTKNLYSKVSMAEASRPHFTKFHVTDVANSLTDSKQIANDAAESERYAYRAKATLIGDASVQVYDAVYLDGLPGGMSGYWTVLSIQHVFGGAAPYLMEVELGTDVLGVTSDAPNPTPMRDVAAELNGGYTTTAAQYVDTTAMAALSMLEYEFGVTKPSAVTTGLVNQTPDFSLVKNTQNWRASIS